MPDLFPPDREPGIGIAEAFARLPLERADADTWSRLATRLPRPGPARPRRWPWAIAAAALLAFAALAPRPTEAPAPTLAATGNNPTDNAGLAPLMNESARLERLLAAASDDGANNAAATALGLALEDQLHAVDVALADSRDPAQQRALWQQRVALLRDAAGLEASRHYLSAEGQSLDMALVAAY